MSAVSIDLKPVNVCHRRICLALLVFPTGCFHFNILANRLCLLRCRNFTTATIAADKTHDLEKDRGAGGTSTTNSSSSGRRHNYVDTRRWCTKPPSFTRNLCLGSISYKSSYYNKLHCLSLVWATKPLFLTRHTGALVNIKEWQRGSKSIVAIHVDESHVNVQPNSRTSIQCWHCHHHFILTLELPTI